MRIILLGFMEPVLSESRKHPKDSYRDQKTWWDAWLPLYPFFLGLTPLHCAVVAHNAVVHELQRNRQSHSPEVQDLLLRNKSLVDTIKCLIQMGAAVEAKVTSQGR
jgi:hypothetical protein